MTHGLTVSGTLGDTHHQNDVGRPFLFPVERTSAVDGASQKRIKDVTIVEMCPSSLFIAWGPLLLIHIYIHGFSLYTLLYSHCTLFQEFYIVPVYNMIV